VFLGDSLTAGYGLAAAEAYPSLVQERLRDAGLAAESSTPASPATRRPAVSADWTGRSPAT